MIFGINPVLEAIEAGKEFEKIFIQKGLPKGKFSEILDFSRNSAIPLSEVPIQKLNSFTGKQHQGIIAFLSIISYHSLDNIVDNAFESGKEPIIIALDGISDVRNFGAISRSAEAMGCDAILLPAKGGAMINSDAIKTSLGALNHIPVCRENNLYNAINYLKNRGLRIVSITEKADDKLNDVNLDGPLCLVLGAEDKGISNQILNLSDLSLRIPLSGKIDSLNVSVAAGIAIYEVSKLRIK